MMPTMISTANTNPIPTTMAQPPVVSVQGIGRLPPPGQGSGT
jgi:hypothetical protein